MHTTFRMVLLKTDKLQPQTKPFQKICGFTLIEILIVIVIISIVSTVGLLSIKVNENKKIETLANQIINTLNLAEQEALLRPITLGMSVNQNRLLFYEYHPTSDPDKNPWTFSSSSVLNTVSIPSNLKLTLKIDGETIHSDIPHVIINPGGDVTAFTLLISKKNSPPRYRIIGEDNGNLKSGIINEEK